jgi:integrase
MPFKKKPENKAKQRYKDAFSLGYCPSLEERENSGIKELANRLRTDVKKETSTNILEWQNNNIVFCYERYPLSIILLISFFAFLASFGLSYILGRWIDLDSKQRIVRVRPEKNSKPRIFHVSNKLLNMLNQIPKKNDHIFNSNARILGTYFREVRKRLAYRLHNPRLTEIHFHTLRHWKATQLYHQTKDILCVKEFLGHRRLDSTLLYINLEKAIYHEGNTDNFHVKIAETPQEIRELLEVGFEYVCEKDNRVFFRKRK